MDAKMDEKKRMLWLADKAMLVHALLAVLGEGWALLIGSPWLGALVAGMFLAALVIWFEWKNGG